MFNEKLRKCLTTLRNILIYLVKDNSNQTFLKYRKRITIILPTIRDGLKHTNYNSDIRKYTKETDPITQLLKLKILPPTDGKPLEYKYKYNGKEWQDELGLNFYDYGARNYDPALGRWMNMDLLAEDYYSESPYSYVANTPVLAFDPDGCRIEIMGSEDYKDEVVFQMALLAAKSTTGEKIIMDAIKSSKTLVIASIGSYQNEFDFIGGKNYNVMAYNTNQDKFLDSENGNGSDKIEKNFMTTLAHEISHFNSSSKGSKTGFLIDENGYSTTVNSDEVYAVEMENSVRKELKMDSRTHYKGINVYGKKAIESNIYKGYYNLVDKDNYAINYVTKSSAQKSTTMNLIYSLKTNQNSGSYYFLGRFLSRSINRPISNKSTVLEIK